MKKYKLTSVNSVVKDGVSFIPKDTWNVNYVEYLEWLDSGNIPDPAEPEANDYVQSQIDSIERETLMNRAVREFMLLSAESAASAQGVTQAQLYAANPAYKAVKDTDTAISLLRAQL